MKRPSINNKQYIVLMCESTTGIILNTDLEYAKTGIDRYYIVVNSLVEIEKIIESQQKSNIHFTIFDHHDQIIDEREFLFPQEEKEI